MSYSSVPLQYGESAPTNRKIVAGKKNVGFLICCINDGLVGIRYETEKAYLIEVTNNFNSCKCAGWQFWVAKSLLRCTYAR